MNRSEILLFCFAILLFASCADRKGFSVHKRRYNPGYYLSSSAPAHRAKLLRISRAKDTISPLTENEKPYHDSFRILTKLKEDEKLFEAEFAAPVVVRKENLERKFRNDSFRRMVNNAKVKRPCTAKAESNAAQLLYGILFLLAAFFCWGLSFYLTTFVATPASALFLIMLVILAGIIFFTIGGYMIRDSFRSSK